MCGVFGYIGDRTQGVPVDEVKRLLHHRGPDDNGSRIFAGEAVFIHTRLSIIDLSSKGRQPMSNKDQTVWIVYNGEIYNYIELKEELSDYAFTTSSDTEVILAAYERWGEMFLARLRGMFALGVYDSREKKLICAVDRFGIKPLYYFHDDEKFIFSSEVKPLWAAGIKLEPDDRAIYDYMVYGLLDHNERTFFKDVRQLRASHYTVYQDGKVNIYRYWDLDQEKRDSDEYLCMEQLVDRKLRESISMHLRSDVEYGLSLSSGLDSNLLRCMISEMADVNKPLQCFSFCYAGTDYDECTCLREECDEMGIRYNKSNIMSKNVLTELPTIINIQEGPIGGAGIYAFWHNMKLASERGIKVVLNGQGADEIFCGYKYYYENWLAELYENNDVVSLTHQLDLYNKEHSTDFKLSDQNFEKLLLSWRESAAVKASDGTSLDAHQYLTESFMRDSKHSPIIFPQKYRSRTKNSMYIDLFYKKIPKLLRFQDKCSMCWGVEVRVPFLDHILAEAVFSLPVSKLINNGKTKSLLRAAAQKYNDSLNSLYSEQIKKYMPTPQREWLKFELAGKVKEMIADSVLHEKGYIDKYELMRQYDEYIREEKLGNSFFIWKFINLELMFRNFFV